MSDDYASWEEACRVIRKQNEKLLKKFEDWLREKKLSKSTIKKHLSNIDFYINEYLLYEDATPAEEGADEIGMFLGDWFVRKAMWSSQAAIKENISSLKKFYTFMNEFGLTSKDDLDEMKDIIKESKDEWLENMRRYDEAMENEEWW